MRAPLLLGLLLVALLALAFAVNANLAANDAGVSWNFESADALEGWTPWVSADIALAPGMGDSGSQALAITIPAFPSPPPFGIRHQIDIVPGGEYTMGGELIAKDAAIQWADMSVSLLDAEERTIGLLSIDRLSGPGSWSAGFSAGCDAVSGYLNVVVSGDRGGTAYIDNLALKGPISTTPCPTATPSPFATPSATATPTASATATPITAATATATSIAAATATAPLSTTAAPTATATPIPPANTPIIIPAALVNGGFESADDGQPLAWRTKGGLLIQSGSPVYSGNWSGGFFSSTSSTKWVYQTLAVQPTAWYALQAQIYHDDPWVEAVLLRISWYSSGDGSGSALATVDSTSVLDLRDGRWRMLTTGPVLSPPGVHSAKARILLRPRSDVSALIYVDGVTFQPADAPAPPTPTTTPPATAPATPPPTASSTPAATFAVPPATAHPSATPTAIATRLAAATATPAPSATGPHAELVNGGFESTQDGRPLAWRTQGGNLLSNSVTIRSGSWAGGFLSSTSSTKWVYQTVTVLPESWYELSAYIYHDDPLVESALLRVSWYASADGSGRALSTADSTKLLQQPEPRWRALSTGPMQAPADAHSAKLRTLLRPRTDANALIYLDDISFLPASPPPPPDEPAAPASQAVGVDGSGSDAAQSGVLAAVDPPAAGPAGDAPVYTPMPAPVIRRQSLLTPVEPPASNEAGSLWPWALVGTMLGVAAVGWGAYLAERSLHEKRKSE